MHANLIQENDIVTVNHTVCLTPYDSIPKGTLGRIGNISKGYTNWNEDFFYPIIFIGEQKILVFIKNKYINKV